MHPSASWPHGPQSCGEQQTDEIHRRNREDSRNHGACANATLRHRGRTKKPAARYRVAEEKQFPHQRRPRSTRHDQPHLNVAAPAHLTSETVSKSGGLKTFPPAPPGPLYAGGPGYPHRPKKSRSYRDGQKPKRIASIRPFPNLDFAAPGYASATGSPCLLNGQWWFRNHLKQAKFAVAPAPEKTPLSPPFAETRGKSSADIEKGPALGSPPVPSCAAEPDSDTTDPSRELGEHGGREDARKGGKEGAPPGSHGLDGGGEPKGGAHLTGITPSPSPRPRIHATQFPLPHTLRCAFPPSPPLNFLGFTESQASLRTVRQRRGLHFLATSLHIQHFGPDNRRIWADIPPLAPSHWARKPGQLPRGLRDPQTPMRAGQH